MCIYFYFAWNKKMTRPRKLPDYLSSECHCFWLLIISCCRRFQLDNIWYFAYRFFNYHITLRCENDWSDLPFTPCRVRYTCLDLSPLVGGRWQYPFMVIWIVRSGKGLCWGVYFSQQNNSLEVRSFIAFKIFRN